MINDLQLTVWFKAKKATVQDTQSPVFFLRKVEAKSRELLWQTS